MKEVDIGIIVLAGLFALRGFWRGLFREAFGLVALLVGIVAALRLTEPGAALIGERIELTEPARMGVAFITTFMAVHTGVTLLGAVFDRMGRALFYRSVNGALGAMFAVGKGGVVMAFVLLFLHLFPRISADLDRRIMDSEIGKPLIDVAGFIVKAGWKVSDLGH